MVQKYGIDQVMVIHGGWKVSVLRQKEVFGEKWYLKISKMSLKGRWFGVKSEKKIPKMSLPVVW